MALDRDKMLAAIAGGGIVPIYKSSIANMAAGYMCSLWRATGSQLWQQGAIPGAAAVPTDDTVGGIILPTFSGVTGRVYRFAPVGVMAGTWFLYDRLAHVGGLSGLTTGSQTINLDPATAVSAGRAVVGEIEWYCEIYTDIGTTAQTCTVTYTDNSDVGSRTLTFSLGGASPLNRASRLIQLVPTDGKNIKSIQSVSIPTSTGTAGSYGFTARKRLTSVSQPLGNVMGVGVDAVSIGLPKLAPAACLEILLLCTTTSSGIVVGELVYGSVAE